MDLDGIKIVEHDVIVVGAGGAGLRAAIECSGPVSYTHLTLPTKA